MTYLEIVNRVCLRLNLTSTDAQTRIGLFLNDRYRRVTTAIGLQVARRTLAQATTTPGSQFLTFSNIEKVNNVIDRRSGTDILLDEMSVVEIRERAGAASDNPTVWAPYRMNSGSVQIMLDCVPQTAFDLYADGLATAADLSGSQTPAFPESFHDVIEWGVLADEYRKMEKAMLARDAEQQFEKRLSDLKLFIIKSNSRDIHQGKRDRGNTSFGSPGGASGVSTPGAQSYTQTGLITFDRSSASPTAPPFAVVANAGVVLNLDADKLDGHHASDFRLLTDAINDSDISFTDITTGNVTSTKHGYAPKSPADATKFLNGAATPAFAQVKDSDLSTSDVTTNNVSTSKHGFAPKGSSDTAKFLRADGSYAEAFALVCQGRLTLTSGNPVTTADVTGATTIYFTPYGGNRIALYDGTNWKLYTFTEKSVALGTLTNDLPYDVFIYDSSGTLTLEMVAWTSKTARATALALQDGAYVKSGTTTKRYLGTFHTTSTTTTEDSATKRLLWNYYNRQPRSMTRVDTTDTWNYTTATFRQANGSTSNQLAVVVGVAEVEIDVRARATASNDTGGAIRAAVAIGEDSTSTPATSTFGPNDMNVAQRFTPCAAALRKLPAVGYHFYAWLEYSTATGVTTWYGDGGVNYIQSGIEGSILG